MSTKVAESKTSVGNASPEKVPTLLSRLLGNQQFLLLIAFIVLVAFFTTRNSVFLSNGEFSNIFADFASLILLGVAETYVIATGGIDLSVGATSGFAGVVAAFAMRSMHGGEALILIVGFVVCVAIGALVGVVNGILMNYAGLVPFVATLVTLGAAGGMSIVLTGGAPIGNDPSAIATTISIIGPFSWPVLVVIAITIVAGLFLHTSRFGKYTFAIGSNEFASRAAGINVKRHLMKVYVLSGVLSGVTGMFFYLRLGSGAPTSGAGAELSAIAAVVIGGASLSGGSARLSGTTLGALILTTVTSGLIIMNVQPNWNQVAVAILIAIAAGFQTLRPSKRRK
ncbi:MAG: ABC transporter permease [Actinomycetota bacterium]|nr:ABC transporter permease [Actinomycetota bacterium]